MTPEKTPSNRAEKITTHLPLAEKILLTTLFIGTILAIMQVDLTVARVSLVGLGLTFFLMAFRPPVDISPEENETGGLSELLALMIVPKVLWISSAISAFGIALYLFNPGNEGHKNLLMIGALTIGIATLLLVTFLVSGVRHIRIVAPILLRAVPICLVGFYILLH